MATGLHGTAMPEPTIPVRHLLAGGTNPRMDLSRARGSAGGAADGLRAYAEHRGDVQRRWFHDRVTAYGPPGTHAPSAGF